jgi:hypothetical protein
MAKKQLASHPGKLTEQQRYLLQRIPSTYRMKKSDIVIPPHIHSAQRMIERWNKQCARITCREERRNEALIQKAREAVYFSSPKKALAIVKQVEKMIRSCES